MAQEHSSIGFADLMASSVHDMKNSLNVQIGALEQLSRQQTPETQMAAPALLQRLGWPGAAATPADLALAPLLRTPVEPWAPWFAAAGLPWPEPAQGPRLVDLGLTLEAALGGQGVALARPALARRWLADGSLVPLFDLTARPAHQYLHLPVATGGAAADFARWLVGVGRAAAAEGLAALRH